MSPRLIRASEGRPQPWKNGLGRTTELAVQTSAARDEFIWRVSIADVDSDAPFSCFPGIDRHIALLEGAGFVMRLDSGRQHALTTPFEPFAFPGEAEVQVRLQGGATRDFNLMVRRNAGRGELTVWSGPGTHRLPTSTVLVHVAMGGIEISGQRLSAGDSWNAEDADPASHEFMLDRGTTVLVVQVLPPAGVAS